MNNALTLITPTCDRPVGLRLCRDWMAAQTFGGPVEWVIVDRGRQHFPTDALGGLPDNWTVRHIKEPHIAKPTVNFRGNLATGLTKATHDRIVIIEDDDHYKPGWLHWLSTQFDDGRQLIGEARSRYYDVERMRCRQMHNGRHASLCQTAFTRRIAEWLAGPRGALRPPHGPKIGWMVDIAIWKQFRDSVPTRLCRESRFVTGMKNLPGRDGLTHIQAVRRDKTADDVNGITLTKWVGETAARVYSEIIERPHAECHQLSEWWQMNDMGAEVIVIGKGPTFDRADAWQREHPQAASIGLNHVVDRRFVDVAHVIDLDVFDQVPEARWFRNCSAVLLPWRPHVNFQPGNQSLRELRLSHPIIRRLHAEGRLLYYNLGTALAYGYCERPRTADIACSTFSGEAVCRLLNHMGLQTIHTAGIDGGQSYHTAFADLQPLTNGAGTFDRQTARLSGIPATITPV